MCVSVRASTNALFVSLFCPFLSNRNCMPCVLGAAQNARSLHAATATIYIHNIENNSNEIFFLIKFLFPLCSFSFALAFP